MNSFLSDSEPKHLNHYFYRDLEPTRRLRDPKMQVWIRILGNPSQLFKAAGTCVNRKLG